MNSTSKPIYVVVDQGRVVSATNIPEGLEVHVIDKDVDYADECQLQISPLDGELCTLTKFGTYGKNPHSSDGQGSPACAQRPG